MDLSGLLLTFLRQAEITGTTLLALHGLLAQIINNLALCALGLWGEKNYVFFAVRGSNLSTGYLVPFGRFD